MKYKELLEKYRNGQLSGKELESIEDEIEKFEAFEEYYSDKVEEEFYQRGDFKEEKGNTEIKNIKKKVDSKLRKIILASVASALALYFLIFYGISPLMDMAFVRPDTRTYFEQENDISIDTSILTELMSPGFISNNVMVERKGFSFYDLRYIEHDTFTWTPVVKRKSIRFGEVKSEEGKVTVLRMIFPAARYKSEYKSLTENTRRYLKELNPKTYIAATLNFRQDISMEELLKITMKYPEISFEWAGIRTGNENIADIMGTSLKFGNGFNYFNNQKLRDEYPALDLTEYKGEVVNENEGKPVLAKTFEQHFLSMINYLISDSNKNRLRYTRPWRESLNTLTLAKKYVEENGFKTYGVLVYAEADELLKILDENPEIEGYILNAIPTKYSIYQIR